MSQAREVVCVYKVNTSMHDQLTGFLSCRQTNEIHVTLFCVSVTKRQIFRIKLLKKNQKKIAEIML